MIDLRLGDYRDVLDRETWDTLICDPPYSARTHGNHCMGSVSDQYERAEIDYAHWTPEDVAGFVAWAAERTRGWMVCMTDSELIYAYRASMEATGRYAFAPVPWINPVGSPRLSGDGPASVTCYLMISRPRSAEWATGGSRPGYYLERQNSNDWRATIGSKPPTLMEALVRDYTKPGDLICDPTAGGATTLYAAGVMGRRAIGAELDPETHAKALRRLAPVIRAQKEGMLMLTNP